MSNDFFYWAFIIRQMLRIIHVKLLTIYNIVTFCRCLCCKKIWFKHRIKKYRLKIPILFLNSEFGSPVSRMIFKRKYKAFVIIIKSLSTFFECHPDLYTFDGLISLNLVNRKVAVFVYFLLRSYYYSILFSYWVLGIILVFFLCLNWHLMK